MTHPIRTRDVPATARLRRCVAGALAGGVLVVAGCGGSSSPPTTVARQTTTVPVPAASQAPRPTGTVIDPGTLPQTTTKPDVGASLQRQMDTLWAAIVVGSTTQARRVFFPESAYLKMKTAVLANPTSDYVWRLIAFLDLDVAAYHAHLGPDPSAAKLVAVESDASLAAWIPPGACENTIGYWHLPGTRLVYASGGQTRSVRVASLISWRGVWYVVHLGPNPRPANVGTVDDPRLGPGVPGPGGGC